MVNGQRQIWSGWAVYTAGLGMPHFHAALYRSRRARQRLMRYITLNVKLEVDVHPKETRSIGAIGLGHETSKHQFRSMMTKAKASTRAN